MGRPEHGDRAGDGKGGRRQCARRARLPRSGHLHRDRPRDRPRRKHHHRQARAGGGRSGRQRDLGPRRIDSPQGALHADPAHGGAATFSITAPASGKPARLAFCSRQGGVCQHQHGRRNGGCAGRAPLYEGTGQFNGKAGYQYSLTVVGAAATGRDGGQIGLRIWHTDPVSHATVIDYDNQRREAAARR